MNSPITQVVPKHTGKVGAGLMLIGSLSGNALQYQTQQSEGQRCQEIVLAQQESYVALQSQCVEALAQCGR